MKKAPFKTVKELQEHFKQLNADALAYRKEGEWLEGQRDYIQNNAKTRWLPIKFEIRELKRKRREWQKGTK
jgi:hypothetical protein